VALIVGPGLRAHPFVLPAFGLWCLLLAAGWLVARTAARRRGRPGPGPATWLFWCAVGAVLAVTLTPGEGTVDFGYWDRHVLLWGHPCLPQWPRTGFGLWAANPERRWNVLLAVPLGLAAGFCGRRPGVRSAGLSGGRSEPPGGARGSTVWAVGAPVLALMLPELVELGQALLPLNRVCALLDVVDNVSGVLIGLGGALAIRLAGHGRSRSRPRRA
jgi:hypothetical protein